MPTVTDNFNRASLGTNWTVSTGGISINASTDVKGTSANADNIMWYNASSFASDHSSTVTLSNKDTSNDGGPIVRHQSAAVNAYLADFGNTSMAYGRFTTGTFNQLGATITYTSAVNDILKLTIAGSTLTANHNGTDFATRSDATYTGGAPGLHMFHTSERWDDWTGTDGVSSTSRFQPAWARQSAHRVGPNIGGAGRR